MFGTILPALFDRPRALISWAALGRTALELESTNEWPAASACITQLLHERVRQGGDFSSVSVEALTTVRFQFPPITRGAPPQAAQLQDSSLQVQADAGGTEVCRAWNFGHAGCTRMGCHFVHACPARDEGCTGEHRGADCPLRRATKQSRKQHASVKAEPISASGAEKSQTDPASDA